MFLYRFDLFISSFGALNVEKEKKVDIMSAAKRVETSRTACECGRGEFVFYACDADRWLYVNNPHEVWFEMHIFCEPCAFKFRGHKLTLFSPIDEVARWKLIIPELDKVPDHSR